MTRSNAGSSPIAIGVACMILLTSGIASAAADDDRQQAAVRLSTTPSLRTQPHAVYVELLGKGGLYSVGYDYTFLRWLGAGGGLSYYRVADQNVLTISPYVDLYPIARGRNTLLLQAGLQIVHSSLASRVDGWGGASATDLGGQLSVGYEYRNSLLIRSVVTLTIGEHGVTPWVGLSFGWSL